MTRISLDFVVMIAAMGVATSAAHGQEAGEDTTLSASGDAGAGPRKRYQCGCLEARSIDSPALRGGRAGASFSF